jgi:hypothetical protein
MEHRSSTEEHPVLELIDHVQIAIPPDPKMTAGHFTLLL